MITFIYHFRPVDIKYIPGTGIQVDYVTTVIVHLQVQAIYKEDADAYMASLGFVNVGSL